APEREHFAKIFASALDAAFVEKGLRVALMPHCTYDVDHEWEDDRAMHRLIRSFSARPEAFSLFEEEATVGDALRLHRGARCVVSNRRHAAIFAAQLGVPSVIFGEPGHIQPIHALLSGEAFLSYDGLSAEGLAAAWGRALGSGETGQEAAAAERRKSDRALAELCDYVLAQ
ncbi:MAG: polysaccharide pyruvyl transferase WcaK-like protein, partial [Thalassolituus oleivorans]